MSRRSVLPPVSIVLAAALALGACGSSSPSSTAKRAAATGSGAATPASGATTAAAVKNGKVTVNTSEYAFAPKAITAKAGKVSFKLVNQGKIVHELIVLKTEAAPGSLKVNPKTARVSEMKSVGEVSETEPGKTKSATLDLKPGTYVYVCNIPTHYMLGMTGTLTVK